MVERTLRRRDEASRCIPARSTGRRPCSPSSSWTGCRSRSPPSPSTSTGGWGGDARHLAHARRRRASVARPGWRRPSPRGEDWLEAALDSDRPDAGGARGAGSTANPAVVRARAGRPPPRCRCASTSLPVLLGFTSEVADRAGHRRPWLRPNCTGLMLMLQAAVLGAVFGARLGLVAALAPLVLIGVVVLPTSVPSAANRAAPTARSQLAQYVFVAVLVASAVGIAGLLRDRYFPRETLGRLAPEPSGRPIVDMFEIGRCTPGGARAPAALLLPGRGGYEDPLPLHPGARGGAVLGAPGADLHQGVPARLRRLPGPRRPAVHRRVQLAPPRPAGRAPSARSTRARRRAGSAATARESNIVMIALAAIVPIAALVFLAATSPDNTAQLPLPPATNPSTGHRRAPPAIGRQVRPVELRDHAQEAHQAADRQAQEVHGRHLGRRRLLRDRPRRLADRAGRGHRVKGTDLDRLPAAGRRRPPPSSRPSRVYVALRRPGQHRAAITINGKTVQLPYIGSAAGHEDHAPPASRLRDRSQRGHPAHRQRAAARGDLRPERVVPGRRPGARGCASAARWSWGTTCEDIDGGLRELAGDADLVVTSGGLGPDPRRPHGRGDRPRRRRRPRARRGRAGHGSPAGRTRSRPGRASTRRGVRAGQPQAGAHPRGRVGAGHGGHGAGAGRRRRRGASVVVLPGRPVRAAAAVAGRPRAPRAGRAVRARAAARAAGCCAPTASASRAWPTSSRRPAAIRRASRPASARATTRSRSTSAPIRRTEPRAEELWRRMHGALGEHVFATDERPLAEIVLDAGPRARADAGHRRVLHRRAGGRAS